MVIKLPIHQKYLKFSIQFFFTKILYTLHIYAFKIWVFSCIFCLHSSSSIGELYSRKIGHDHSALCNKICNKMKFQFKKQIMLEMTVVCVVPLIKYVCRYIFGKIRPLPPPSSSNTSQIMIASSCLPQLESTIIRI